MKLLSTQIEALTRYPLLPELKTYLDTFPFGPTSMLRVRGLIYPPEDIIARYAEFLLSGFGERPWPKEYLPLGRNDQGDVHCVQLTSQAGTVLLADFESLGEEPLVMEEMFASFTEWLDYSLDYDASLGEWKEDEEDEEEI